jgi:D-glycero-D-manno-heptose 1,7-bisphosphate phosphatase
VSKLASVPSSNLKPAVFLDRDGVVNQLVYRDGKAVSPRSIEAFVFVSGIQAAVKRLKAAGFPVFIVTNQPDIARGKMAAIALDQMTERIYQTLPIDDLRVCPHDDCDDCTCRKPRPGMLLDLAARWQVNLSRSFIVGDSWKDIQAGKQAGCRTILIAREYNQGSENQASGKPGSEPDWSVAEVEAAVDVILNQA